MLELRLEEARSKHAQATLFYPFEASRSEAKFSPARSGVAALDRWGDEEVAAIRDTARAHRDALDLPPAVPEFAQPADRHGLAVLLAEGEELGPLDFQALQGEVSPPGAAAGFQLPAAGSWT